MLRHAKTGNALPGEGDHDRRLTTRGEAQAQRLGKYLRERGIPVDAVLCSDSVRTRQTYELLRLPAPTYFDESRRYYGAGGDELLQAVRELDEELPTALLVGHAPGVPAVVYDLADPATADPAAFAAIETRFPPGTLAELEIIGSWADLASARLVQSRLPEV